MFPFLLFKNQGGFIMKRQGVVVIDGVEYSVGSKTQDGFFVMKPQKAILDARALADVLNSREKTITRASGVYAFEDLRDFSKTCLSHADKVEVEVVAFRETGADHFSFKCVCLCGETKKVRIFSSDLIEGAKPPLMANREEMPCRTVVAKRMSSVYATA